MDRRSGHTGRARCSRDRGVTLLEFAILLPLLALIVFGTLDLGRAFQLKNELKNAAREGAAYAQNYPTRETANAGVCANPENILYHARKELPNNGTPFEIKIDGSTPAGCDAAAAPAPGTEITVSASKDFDLFSPFVGAIVGDSIKVTESVTVVVL